MCAQTARVHLCVDCVLFLWAFFFKKLATKAFIYSRKHLFSIAHSTR